MELFNSIQFTSNIGEEFSKQLGIVWKYTASHSPHSNGSCERNHGTVDRKFEKSVKDSQSQVDLKNTHITKVHLTALGKHYMPFMKLEQNIDRQEQ